MNLIYLFIFIIIIYLLKSFFSKNLVLKNENTPWALPILGHLHLLSGDVHLSVLKLMKSYNNTKVMKLWLGDKFTIMVRDPEMVREIYMKNFENFIDRGKSPMLKWVGFNYKGLAFSSEKYWRENKSLVVNFFSNQKIRKVSFILENQCKNMLKALESHINTTGGEEFSPKIYCQKYSMNNLTKYLYSLEVPFIDENTNDKESQVIQLLKAMDHILEYVGKPSLIDMIEVFDPLRSFYLDHFKTELNTVRKHIINIYNDHLATIDRENPRDLMDSMIIETNDESKENIDRIVSIGIELLLAGSETTSSTIEWFLLLMANYPEIQEKIYAELQSIFPHVSSVGNSEKDLITLSNKQSTPYVKAAINECLRYKPTGPFSFPRVAAKDITINGVFIPKGAEILQFTYGLFKSDDFWISPNEFLPERFLSDSHSDVFFPFALGSRNCLGNSLAKDELYLAITNILYNYKIHLPDGVKFLDESECMGLTFHAKSFNIRLTKR